MILFKCKIEGLAQWGGAQIKRFKLEGLAWLGQTSLWPEIEFDMRERNWPEFGVQVWCAWAKK